MYWGDDRIPAVYILASRSRVLYVGVTTNLPGRIALHRAKAVPGFTAGYRVDHLVWYEIHSTIYSAIQREKRLKRWRRRWKVRLIERRNPDWSDLSDEVLMSY